MEQATTNGVHTEALGIRLPGALMSRLRFAAALRDQSLSDVTRGALERHLDRLEAVEPAEPADGERASE